MTEFVIRLADERGRVQEQTHAAATAEELRARFTQAGYYVYSVKARGLLAGAGKSQEGEAGDVPGLQPAVSDADSRRAADSELDRAAGAPAEAAALPRATGGRCDAGEERRVDLRVVRGAGRLSDRLHHHAAGGRAVGQSGRGAAALSRLPAGEPDVSARS